jgi:hypothetical protein
MASLATKLYATQNNGGSPSVLVSDIVALASSSGTPATTTTLGVVKQAAHIANSAVPFADLTAAANAYNALLAGLQTAGLMA